MFARLSVKCKTINLKDLSFFLIILKLLATLIETSSIYFFNTNEKHSFLEIRRGFGIINHERLRHRSPRIKISENGYNGGPLF